MIHSWPKIYEWNSPTQTQPATTSTLDTQNANQTHSYLIHIRYLLHYTAKHIYYCYSCFVFIFVIKLCLLLFVSSTKVLYGKFMYLLKHSFIFKNFKVFVYMCVDCRVSNKWMNYRRSYQYSWYLFFLFFDETFKLNLYLYIIGFKCYFIGVFLLTKRCLRIGEIR